jgi:hypothetical protein
MIARRDYRADRVTLAMARAEFREHVEWLEGMAPQDGCTRDWRAELDRIDPPETEEEDDVPAQS